MINRRPCQRFPPETPQAPTTASHRHTPSKKYNNMGKIIGAIVVDTDRCKGCSLCVVACPKGVIALAQKAVNVHGYPYAEAVKPDDCIGCASCGIVCPDGCITVYRKKKEE